ncbi:alpha/beta fold hydrolase [Lichenicoccus roseus]|uniref:Alpha/beta hydrolase n=1 Tax=Lichenicoccus roseus TaxID=2683649 RepID=A0A5R9JHD0_9PROT|nr:alpha/beta hydrolase [Lichenicoccus roseus]TLU73718.1 alpha/beta hydrolase [Lichenicoccus roseus]
MTIRAALLLTLLAIVPAAASPADNAIGYSHPQRRISVGGGRRLNLFCIGDGTPTVILEAGSGGSTADWWRIQQRLAGRTRTCAYDRAGYGYSDPARRPSDAEAAVDDLHRLIAKAALGQHPVIVGHSNGGLYATLYAERHADEIGGLVLVDPGFPGQQDYAGYGLASATTAALQRWASGLIDTGRHCLAMAEQAGRSTIAKAPECVSTPPEDPSILRRSLRRIYMQKPYEAANLSELECSFGIGRDGLTRDDREFPAPLRALGDLPLIVLTAEHHPAPVGGFTQLEQARFWQTWKQGHDRLAQLSSAGISIVVSGSGHFIQNDKPDAVAQAVRDVVSAARRNETRP